MPSIVHRLPCCSTAATPVWFRSGRRSWPRRLPSARTPKGEILRLDDASLEDDPDRIYVELQTAPMFGGRKIVRAAAGRRITAAQLKPLVEGEALEGYLIVEAGNLRPDDALRSLFEKSASAAAVACFPDEARDLDAVIREVFAATKVQITPEAKRLLILRLGADRALSRAEIDKLALYAHGKSLIDESDVEAAVGDAAELALDRIVMAAASGRAAAALAECDRSVASGESPQGVIAALQRHFLRLHRMRGALDSGRSMDEVLAIAAPAAAFQAARRARAAGPQLERAQAQRRPRPHRRGRQGRAPQLGPGGNADGEFAARLGAIAGEASGKR